jgi:divalent metal cation (Fe/Co/Zn/Cd) transporter
MPVTPDAGHHRHRALAAALIVIALVCLGLAIFYFTQKTTFLAGAPARIQLKHGLLFAGLAVLSAIGANILWRRGD